MGTGPQPGVADLATHLVFAGERKPHWLVWGPIHCTDLGGLGNLPRTARAGETVSRSPCFSPCTRPKAPKGNAPSRPNTSFLLHQRCQIFFLMR